jgi:sterol 3beta-glucosyltransferase
LFKSTAAVMGIPAYPLKGLERAIEKRSDRGLKAQILEVRLRQGMAAFRRATEGEKEEVLRAWGEFGGVVPP